MTVLEMMVVVAILGILATLAVTQVLYGSGRARLNNATWEISAMSSVAQMRAASRGTTNYLVFYETKDETGVFRLERREVGGVAVPPWTSIDPHPEKIYDSAGGAALDVRVDDRIKLSGTNGWQRGGVRFENLGVFGAPKPPFGAIPLKPSGASGLMAACNFCIAGSGGSFIGAVRYGSDGRVSLATTGAGGLGGGAVALAADRSDEAGLPRLIAISVPSGAINVIHKD